jgi:hypothetical protein
LAKKKASVRNLKREAERNTVKLRRDVVRVEAARVGGHETRPIDVTTASLVEPRAVGEACPLCGGELRLESHDAETRGGVRLRIVRVVCKMCRSPWERFYRIVSETLN